MAIKKMNYYKGEFLHAEDFKCDQDFHSSLRKTHNISLHTSGIAYGLGVIAGAGKITVKKGMAIDSQGRELILDADRDVAVNSPTSITITYLEVDDPPTTEAGFTGVKQSTVTCKVIAGTDPDGIVLATVTNAAVNPVTLNAAYKPPCASPVANGDMIIGGNLEVKGKLTVQGDTRMVSTDTLLGNVVLGDADTDTVTIEGSLLTGHTSGKLKIGSPVDITGGLSVTESLSLQSGKEIFFADNGQIRSLDNNHKILFRRPENKLELREYGDLIFSPGATTGAETAKVVMQSNGNVGIGTAGPSHKFHVLAQDAVGLFESSGSQAYLRFSTSEGFNNRVEICNRPGGRLSLWTAGAGDVFNITRDGTVGIGTLTPTSKLTVVGSIAGGETATGWVLGRGAWGPDNWLRLTTSQNGSTYHDLAINAFWAAGSKRYDLAEVTPVKEEDNLEPGDAVVIDTVKGMRVTRSKIPCDTAVYGIVSSYEQASMVIGGDSPESVMKEKNKLPIALVGRIKAKVSTEAGAIQVGDILTTSSLPGYLMKADPRKAVGAIAGKALEPLMSGNGNITVLVTLA